MGKEFQHLLRGRADLGVVGDGAEVLTAAPDMFGGGVAPFALDPANAVRLWDLATRFMS